ncbi:sialidase-1 [Streptomyces griseochromogenes]|uniref:exo-alpha-sialidase n=1 Tax=Streptomyces griseochromogenes TaxID=68214 RepID=A0A1B1B7B0_9ACTN|nr:sialidase family protein [Streptomyces griseochromogenes]ANP54677.1 alpha-sialidase [Streptomyces griseochromogenes]MBP2048770.1 sialidase-1 [Streptomyces griseochromogenes]
MTDVSVPFRAGHEGYASFRIPAVVATHPQARLRSAGGTPVRTLLAFCEGRAGSAADHGHIDIVLKRSTDGGRTWGPLRIAASNGKNLAGNPAPVVLDTGRILLVHVRAAATATEDAILRGRVKDADGRRVWTQYSDDDGVTWSKPREITAQVKKPGWRWYATTPGHALQLASGRVLVPGNHTLPPTGTDTGAEAKYNGGHCLLSDDRGETWYLGYLDDNTDGYINANETTAAELPDGRVYFNTRNDSPSPGNRADAHSADGGRTLVKPFRPQAGLTTPVCEASVLQLRDPDLLLLSAPADPSFRALMTIRASGDGGTTWRTAFTVDGLPAAYSDLVRIDRSTVGLLYETGDFSAYETITFRRVPVTRLT